MLANFAVPYSRLEHSTEILIYKVGSPEEIENFESQIPPAKKIFCQARRQQKALRIRKSL